MENVVKADGGDWSKVKRIPNTVTDEAQDVKQNPDHAIWVFDGWGGVNAQVNHVEVDKFFFKDLNPTFDYYTPILIANNDLIKNDPETVKAFLSATKRVMNTLLKIRKKLLKCLLTATIQDHSRVVKNL